MNTAAKPAGTELAPVHKQVLMGIDKMRDTLQGSLPSDVSVDKFTSVVKTALNTNPDLLKADRQSLYNECVRAAQDGLLPDGREGALVVFGGKVKWMPMIGGLRKKAAKHGFDLIAQVVYENDEFEFQLGDEPKILHVPVPLNQNSGPLVGAYAIATELKTGAKYREVMNKEEIEAVKGVSKSKDSGPWAGAWYSEMARKTVCRRLFKQLPFYMEDDIQTVISHENEDFEMGAETAGPGSQAASAPASVRDKVVGNQQPATAEPSGGEDAEVI